MFTGLLRPWLIECDWRSFPAQRAAWNGSDTTSPDAVAQQASTLAALTVGSPDQFSPASKLDVVNFALQVAAHIDASNGVAVNNLLSAVGAMSASALESVKAALASARSTSRRLLQLDDYDDGHDAAVVGQWRRLDSLGDLAREVLSGTTSTYVAMDVRLVVCLLPVWHFATADHALALALPPRTFACSIPDSRCLLLLGLRKGSVL